MKIKGGNLMSKEENILYNKTQELGRTQFVRELLRLQQEKQQLKDNWNKLKEYLKETVNSDCYSPYDGYDWQYILEKMQELEKGESDE